MIYLFTGDGQGKTSAALGIALRAWGWGRRVKVIQFLKANQDTGEYRALSKLPGVEVEALGAGFYRVGDDQKSVGLHHRAAQQAWEQTQVDLTSGRWDLVILDELSNALDYGLLPTETVVAGLQKLPSNFHLVITGRNAPKELVELADLVSEVKKIKHPFDRGAKALKGLDY